MKEISGAKYLSLMGDFNGWNRGLNLTSCGMVHCIRFEEGYYYFE
jgi:hypothetical protein